MPLPLSGPISFNDINVELGVSGTTEASLGQPSFRTLAGIASGPISMSDFYGKANAFTLSINSNQTNPNLRTLALAGGWDGTVQVIATIEPGIYCGSNSTGTPGLTINGAFPGGVSLTNNGYIIGMGGNGGTSFSGPSSTPPGGAGGLALSAQTSVTITNNGTIAGGGGGGSGGVGSLFGRNQDPRGGGGGGGGRSSHAANSSGGPGGASSIPGSSGTVSSQGPGGAGGGPGGGWGSAGVRGTNRPPATSGLGGAGGGAVSGNSNITWISTGTRLGSIT